MDLPTQPALCRIETPPADEASASEISGHTQAGMPLLEELNPPQREAVDYAGGPLLILAGAGSGKTRVIAHRIARLIEGRGVRPENILAVTFTNKAAEQMKERVARLLSARLETWPHISTFHSFCVSVLRRHIERLDYSRDFSIYDEADQQRVVKAALHELGLEERTVAPRAALSRISYAKNSGSSPEALYRQAADLASERLASLYERYERRLRQANALDFDDLLLKAAELFEAAPDLADAYNRRFEHLLVDEYQDTNRIQYQLIRQLTRQHQNICAVGDEDQSIYRWRGADIRNILNFERDFPATRIIRLEQNYRSTQMILDAATAVVSHNRERKGKTLWTDRGPGFKVGLYAALDAEDEASFAAAEIDRVLRDGTAESIAVLYRTNAQSRAFEEALRSRGIEYRLVGGFSFYERAEIKDVLAYARLASNRRDSAALLRCIKTPPRGLGETTLEALEQASRARNLSLWQVIEQEMASPSGLLGARAIRALGSFRNLIQELAESRPRASLPEFFRNILERTSYLQLLRAENSPEAEARIENLAELVNAAAEAHQRGESLAEFLDHAALVSGADQYDERARVTLMTFHSAKGLEFSWVFLAGLEEGLFPHQLSLGDEAGLEEERRLCYVGMTRARERLFLSWVSRRRSYGREMQEETRRSRFLDEIPSQLIDRLNEPVFSPKPRLAWSNAANSVESVEMFLTRHARGRDMIAGSSPRTAQGELKARWPQGTRVRHPKYGIGTVLESEGEGEGTKLTVSFPGYGRKKLVERYASLERL
jgi:DNA helicase-2/ATP-dependent DNA helicase PcrA